MTAIDARLLVTLKGMDLTASTAELALVDKMGYADTLLGLKRFDFFHFRVDTPAEARPGVSRLQRVLDRQSTFYNRNKHAYSLECRWDGESLRLGVERSDWERRWLADIYKSLTKYGVRDLDRKDSSNGAILSSLGGFLVEVRVEYDDPSARDAVAERLRGGFAALDGPPGVAVACENCATLWWLAIRAEDAETARQTAREISVTTRRERGLLMNPNCQRADFVSVKPIESESK